MRVIGGEFRSRLLKSVPGVEVRPTPDRLRESLFNILTPVIAGTVFVDAYAGSGAVGIEALSRGAERAVFIEKSREASEVIWRNLESLGLRSRAAVWTAPVRKKIQSEPVDIVFLDPPYPEQNEYATVLEILGYAPPRLFVIAQHSSRFSLGEQYGALKQFRELKQGENKLTFFRAEPAEDLDQTTVQQDL